MCNLSGFASLNGYFVELFCSGLRHPLRNAHQNQIAASRQPSKIPDDVPTWACQRQGRTAFRPMVVRTGPGLK